MPVGTNKLSKEQISIRNPKIPLSKGRLSQKRKKSADEVSKRRKK